MDLASCAPLFDVGGGSGCRGAVQVDSEVSSSDGVYGFVEHVVSVGVSVDLDFARSLAERVVLALVLVDLPGVFVLAWNEDGGSIYLAWVFEPEGSGVAGTWPVVDSPHVVDGVGAAEGVVEAVGLDGLASDAEQVEVVVALPHDVVAQ